MATRFVVGGWRGSTVDGDGAATCDEEQRHGGEGVA